MCVWLGTCDRFLLVFRERSAYLLHPRVSFKSDVLGLLVGSLPDWRRRFKMRGISFEFSGRVFVVGREAREVPIKHNSYVVVHNFEIK